MKNFYQKTRGIFNAVLATALFTFLPARALAQTLDRFEADLRDLTQNVDNAALPTAVFSAIARYLGGRIIPMLISAAVALGIIFLMYGSMQYFMAYGDENRATSAKKTITYAFLGLILAFMAMGIAGLVQRSITNSQAPSAQQAPVH